MDAWTVMPRGGERLAIGPFCCEVWEVYSEGGGKHGRYTVLDTNTGCYVKGGRCASLEWAREVSANFARSLVQL